MYNAPPGATLSVTFLSKPRAPLDQSFFLGTLNLQLEEATSCKLGRFKNFTNQTTQFNPEVNQIRRRKTGDMATGGAGWGRGWRRGSGGDTQWIAHLQRLVHTGKYGFFDRRACLHNQITRKRLDFYRSIENNTKTTSKKATQKNTSKRNGQQAH